MIIISTSQTFSLMKDDKFYKKFISFSFQCAILVSWSTQILFNILIRHATIMFADLNKQIQDILSPNNSTRLISNKLETWRQNHVLVCQLVDNINQCFGLMLLISISCYFISFIVMSYQLYKGIMNFSTVQQFNDEMLISALTIVLVMLKNAVHFVLIVLMPYQMQQEVRI